MNYTHIRLDERYVIQRLKNNKASVKQIAFIIGKHHTITFDNGTEFSGFNDIEQFLNCKVYFTDTHSLWQRELNEYTNRLIRQYLPKKTYFKNINQKDIDGIQNKINMRPRKVLDYLSPYGVFRDLKV